MKIRSTSLYDTLGYMLSVVGTLPAEKTDSVRDYYLPLLAPYANWCYKISQKFHNQYGTFMYHIAWFQPSVKTAPQRKVLIGSTIGSNPTLRSAIKDARAATLQKAGFTAPPPQGQDQSFGGCAETSFFLYAKQ